MKERLFRYVLALLAVLLTGIRAINLKITQGINIFDDNERDTETDHRPPHP